MNRALPAAALLLLAAPAALAHGGQYQPPVNTGGGIPIDSEILDPRVPVPTPPRLSDLSPWERWWECNRDRIVDLRGRIRARDAGEVASGGKEEERDDFFDEPGDGGAAAAPKKAPDGPAVTREFVERVVLPSLTGCLGAEDPEVRSAATLALGKLGFPRTLVDLQKTLADPVRDVRESAVLALGMAGDSLAADQLRAILLDPKSEERMRGFAAVGLGLLGGPEAGEALLAFFDPSSDARFVGGIRRRPETACCVLSAIGLARPAGAAPLLHAMAVEGRNPDGTKADAGVRSFALVALAKLGDGKALPPETLLGLLDEDREVLRQGAALALGIVGKPGDTAVVKGLGKTALGDRDRNARALAVMALSRIGGPDAAKALRGLLPKVGRPELPFVALALGIVKDAESAPAIRAAFLEGKDPETRGACALALGLLGDAASAPALREVAFGGGPRGLRRHCMVGLGLLGDKASAEELRTVASGEWDPFLKVGAATALGLLQDPKALPLLQATAKGATSILARGHACRLLGLIGNREAATLLCRFARDRKETGYLRMHAVSGLGVLGERGDRPLLTLPLSDLDPEIRVDALDTIAGLL